MNNSGPDLQEQAQRIQSLELKTTGDGSLTLFVPGLQEHYHSVHGAMQESRHVFIEAGLKAAANLFAAPLNILEIGLGTGLNAVLSWKQAEQDKHQICYDTVEAFPLPWQLLAEVQPNYPEDLKKYFKEIHQCAWQEQVSLSEHFVLRKLEGQLQDLALQSNYYQVIFFDAFAPEKQPELWERAIFEKICAAMQPGGLLVTYCAKGSVKRSLRAAGFKVEALPGPPGKREMTRAIRS